MDNLMDEALYDRLTKAWSYTEEEQKVRDWVYKNREMFIEQDWTAVEVGELARFVDVADIMAIHSVLTHFRDALYGGHFQNRAAMKEWDFERAVHDFQVLEAKQKPKSPTRPLWEDLAHEFEGVDIAQI